MPTENQNDDGQMVEEKSTIKIHRRTKCERCHHIVGKITKVYSGETTNYSRDLKCDDCRNITKEFNHTQHQSMSSDADKVKHIYPLYVNTLIEGCTNEIVSHTKSLKVEETSSRASSTERVNKSDLFENCNITPQIIVRKKCTLCSKILHDSEKVEPLAGFHERCFKCQRCHKLLTPSYFKMVAGVPYCEPICQSVSVVVNDTNNMNSIKKSNVVTVVSATPAKVLNVTKGSTKITQQCALCQEVGDADDFVAKDGSFYHHKCVKCDTCKQEVDINDRTWISGRPFCKQHYESTLKSSNMQSSFTSGKSIPVQITKPVSTWKYPTQTDKTTTKHNSVSLDSLSEVASHTSSQHKSITIERRSNKRHESGFNKFSRRSRTPPINHTSHFESRANSMKNMSGFETEHYCNACGKDVFPLLNTSHRNRIYHDSCLRCDVCHYPITASTMHTSNGQNLCQNHYLNACRRENSMEEIINKRALSLERVRTYSSGDETVTIDDDGCMIYSSKPTSVIKINSGPAFTKDNYQEQNRNNSNVSVVVNRKQGTSSGGSHSSSVSVTSPGEIHKTYRVRNASPYSQTIHTESLWSGEITRKTEISKTRKVRES